MKKKANKEPRSPLKRNLLITVTLVIVVLAAAGIWAINQQNNKRQALSHLREQLQNEVEAQGSAGREVESTVRGIVSSEELILELTKKIKPLKKSLKNLQIPDIKAASLFSDQIKIKSRIEKPNEAHDLPNGLLSRKWKISKNSERVSLSELSLWENLFDGVSYVDNGKFYFIRGAFAEDSFEEFHAVMGSSGMAKYQDGQGISWSAKLKVTWALQKNDEKEEQWKISEWKVDSFKTVESKGSLFADVLEDAISDDQSYSLATFSQHEKMTSDLLNGKQVDRSKGDNYPFFFAEVTLEHPGVSVVDIDKDGYDDAFIAMQHGKNLLLRNLGDGTFEEVSEKYSVDKTGQSSSAIFADFDNDGDPDLFLGRPRHRGQYLVNEEGTFVDRTKELITVDLPFMVTSISAADYNGDGLLDVYLSTYSPLEDMHQITKDKSTPIWAKQYLAPEEIEEFSKRLNETHVYLGRPGPPNMLLTNVGNGKFELAKENKQVQLWRKTFQGTWSDYDSDGDPDLYVANDYGPDNFLRNDGEKGFTDITEEAGLGAMGFGMGVTWGDYDNDGQLDLYVSNMFSKAGQRITSQVDGIDSRFLDMAAGNFLYRYDDQKFTRVSGPTEPSLQVEKAGWSWGGQFLDFNNDGYQDLYAASGFYTAPADVAVDIDL